MFYCNNSFIKSICQAHMYKANLLLVGGIIFSWCSVCIGIFYSDLEEAAALAQEPSGEDNTEPQTTAEPVSPPPPASNTSAPDGENVTAEETGEESTELKPSEGEEAGLDKKSD